MPFSCADAQRDLAAIHALREQFTSALATAAREGDFREAKKLRGELEHRLAELREKIDLDWKIGEEVLSTDVQQENWVFSASGRVAVGIRHLERLNVYSATVNDQPTGHTFLLRPVTAVSPDGKHVSIAGIGAGGKAVQITDEGEQTLDVDAVNELAVANNGRVAAVVKMPSGRSGLLVNGTVQHEHVGAQEVVMSPDGRTLVVISEQTTSQFMRQVTVNGQDWDHALPLAALPGVSEDGSTVAVRLGGGDDHESISVNDQRWSQDFPKVGRPVVSARGEVVAAAVIRRGFYMQATVAVNGMPWTARFTAVGEPALSRDGTVVAAPVKHGQRLTVAVNGQAWPDLGEIDSILKVAISPDGTKIMAVVERNDQLVRIVRYRDGSTSRPASA